MRSPTSALLALLLAAAGGVSGCGAGLGGVASPAAMPITPAAVLATIPVAKGPILLALSPDGSRLYATSQSGKLAVIDTARNAVVQNFDVPPYSTGIAVTPDGQKVFVNDLFGTTLTVLDTNPAALAPPLMLVAQFQRGGYGRLAISPDSSTAYLVNQDNLAFFALDLSKDTTDNYIMDMRPADVALTPDGSQAVICGCKDFCVPGTCVMFDTSGRRFGAYLSAGANPYRVAVDPRGATAYVTSLGGSSLSVIDLVNKQTTATIAVPMQPTGLAVAADGNRVYVSSQTPGTLAVIDAKTNTVLATWRVSDDAREVAVSADGRRAYVSTANGVVVLDAKALVGP
jgi:YVTN family beta-propeller protein